jgi:hypothetical protein
MSIISAENATVIDDFFAYLIYENIFKMIYK